MEDCGDAGRQQGYEAPVANLAYDLAKSIHSNVTGYLILLQVRPLNSKRKGVKISDTT